MDSNQGIPAWEQSKENVQPLARGRNIQTLNAALSKPLVSALSTNNEWSIELQQQRDVFEAKIKHLDQVGYDDDSDENPIKVWREYIQWSQDHFPTGKEASTLTLKLLERCTRQYSYNARLKKDAGFLRIWIMYADMATRDPSEIFAFMYSNDIGTNCALFYEAYATVLEKKHMFAMADKIYTEGVARRANPTDRLQKRHQEFQQRMARRVQRQQEQRELDKSQRPNASVSSQLQGHDENSAELKERGVMQKLSSNQAQAMNRKLVPAVVNHMAAGPGSSNGYAPMTQSTNSPNTGRSLPHPSAPVANAETSKFTVFADPGVGNNGVRPKLMETQAKNDKAAFPAMSSASKENSALPTKWNEPLGSGTQSAATVLPRGSAVGTSGVQMPFAIFQDTAAGNPPAPAQSVTKQTSALKNREHAPQAGDIKLPALEPTQVLTKGEPTAILVAPQDPVNKNPNSGTMGQQSELLMGQRENTIMYQQSPAYKEVKIDQKSTPLARKLAFEVSEPTINTRLAMRDVEAMFNSPLPFEGALGENDDDDTFQFPTQPVAVAPSMITPRTPQPANGESGSSRQLFAPMIPNDENMRFGSVSHQPALPASHSAIPAKSQPLAPVAAHWAKPPLPSKLVPPSVHSAAALVLKQPPFVPSQPQTLAGTAASNSSGRPFEIFSDTATTAPSSAFKPSTESTKIEIFEDSSTVAPAPETQTEDFVAPLRENVPVVNHDSVVVDPQSAEIRYSVEELIAPWFAEQLAYKLIDQSPAFIEGEIVTLNREESDASTFFVQKLLASDVNDNVKVFGIERMDQHDDTRNSSLNTEMDLCLRVKIAASPTPWEFYMLSMVKERVSPNLWKSYIEAEAHYDSEAASYLLTKCYGEQGSLEYILGLYQSNEQQMPLYLVLFYTIEMLKVLAGLHRARILHNNISLRSFFARNESVAARDWGSWDPSGSNGWNTKGVICINFANAIDLELHEPKTIFQRGGVDKVPWCYDADCKQMAAIIDFMLRPLIGSDENDGGDGSTSTIHDQDSLDVLGALQATMDSLNQVPCSNDTVSVQVLQEEQQKLESILCEQKIKAKTLKNLLMRQNMMIYDARSSDSTTIL